MPLSEHNLQRLADDIGRYVEKTIVFDGAETDDPGDFDGTNNPLTLFRVTGTVLLRLFARCNQSLVGDRPRSKSAPPSQMPR